MSQTISLCSKCGGAIVGDGHSYYGKRCTCSHAGGVAVATAAGAPMTDASASMSAGHKFCCKCGADVTHAKRMKDHLHRYWCYDCGAADQLKRGAGLALKCPDCNHHFPPTKMLKHGEEYVCEACHEERAKHRGGTGLRFAKVLVTFLIVAAIVGAMAVYALDLQLLP
jgi:hypothetical protein